MLRWLLFGFGGLLLVTTAFLANYRANHAPDSTAIVVFHDDYYNSGNVQLVRVDMLGRTTPLFNVSYDNYQNVEYYAWSPDGKWLLVLVRDNEQTSSLYVVSATNTSPPILLVSTALFDYPRWPPDSQEIVIASQAQPDSRDKISIQRLALDGEIIAEYMVDVESRSRWNFAWFDAQTLWLTYSPNRATGYFVDFPTGKVSPNTEFKFPQTLNAVAPNGNWFIEVRSRGIELKDWYTPRNVQRLIPTEQIPLTTSFQMGWSGDSQWVALLGYEGISQQTNGYYANSTDIYIANATDTEIIQLTDDDRAKSLIQSDEQNRVIQPFSYHNNWLLYLDEGTFDATIQAVKTDGSGDEITDLFVTQSYELKSAKWSPPIDSAIQHTLLIWGGILLMIISLVWSAQIRTQT